MNKLALVVASLPGLAIAQSTFVVPSKANTTQPGRTYFDSSVQSWPFYGSTSASNACRVQYLYDVADIPTPVAVVTALAVRKPANSGGNAATYQTQITMSVGPNASAAPTSSFAANHGTAVTVFNGSISLPTVTGAAWPAPWQTPIALSAPFTYVAASGNSLVVEFETTSSSTNATWALEGYRAEIGNSGNELYQSNCRNSGGQASGGWGWNSGGLVPGGNLSFSLSGYPINTPSLANNILFISTAGLGSPIGPFITPFDLSLVAPAQANCRWAIDIVNAVSVPMVYQQSTSSASLALSPALPIANTPFMANRNLYTQNLAIDVDSSSNLVLFPSIAIKWLIGTGNRVPVSNVRAVYNPTGGSPATGSIAVSDGASLQFTY